jgi:hypothetical protein
VTPLGNAVMQQGEAIFQDLRAKWEQQIGAEELAKIEASLIALIGATPISLDAPGDIVSDIGEA